MRDGRIIFGAGLVFGTLTELENTDVHEGSSRAVLDSLQKRVRELHPTLREVSFQKSRVSLGLNDHFLA